MKITIPKNRFLKQKSLTSSGTGFSWGESDEESYCLGDSNACRSIDPVFELLSLEKPQLISTKILKTFEILGADLASIPIDGVQSPEKMIEEIKEAFKQSRIALECIQESGYLDTFMECNRTLKRVQRAQTDGNSINRGIKTGKIKNVSVAKGFISNSRDNFLSLPKYSVTKTLTGRMTITEGPQILTAPKLIRKYFKSSYPGGKIAQVDFVSHEPRTAMLLTDKDLGSDIYESLGSKLFDKPVSRSAVKKLVLCAVYGASESTLKKGLPEGVNIKRLVEKTKSILNYDMVVREQKKNYESTGRIKNFFGRPIKPSSARDSLLYNNYIQSTGVDVALLGFGQILDKAPSRVRPIFFIHDAMLVDIHPDDIEDFKNISSSIFIEGLGEFPLDFQILS